MKLLNSSIIGIILNHGESLLLCKISWWKKYRENNTLTERLKARNDF